MLGAKLGITSKQYNIITNGLTWHQEPGMDKCYPGSTLTYNLANMNISGTLVNDTTVTGTVPGRAYEMDGTDDYIQGFNFTGLEPQTSPYSIFFWINFDAQRSDTRIINRQVGNYGLTYNLTTGVFSQWVNGTSSSNWSGLTTNVSSIYANGVWNSFAYTVSGDSTSVVNSYINGAQDSNTSNDWTGHGRGTWQTSNTMLNGLMDLGREYLDSYGEDLDGKMGTFLVYDRVLSSGEILQTYNATKDRYLT